MRFRPCIDLHEGRVKQIVGSSLSDSSSDTLRTNFDSDKPSSYYAELYKRNNLNGGHVIMLGPGNEMAAIEALKVFPGGLQVGGGIIPDNARQYLDAGASHVIVTSFVFKDGLVNRKNLEQIVDRAGKEHLVLDLSCKQVDNEYYIATDRWQNISSVKISKEVLNDFAQYCDEFLVHAADVEGKLEGIDENLVRILGEFSPVPVTYAGGIRSIKDMERIYLSGNNRVDATIGSALDIFGGPVAYNDIVSWHKAHAGY